MRKQFTEDYNMITNWDDDVLLCSETFTTETNYNALNLPVTIINPDETELSYGYDKGGLLQKVLQNATEHITNITYNEKGQRKNIYYGNNTKTRYYYNPLNFRLTRILTTRNTGINVLQDLNYLYDAVGNITQITDDAQQTHYFDNQVIAPTATFEYDALYRLTKATGRELTALTAPTENDFANNLYCPNPAADAMQNYTHQYTYDLLGNILSDHWKTYQYAVENNYLLGNDNILKQFSYDAHGNTLTMPHLSQISYDYNDRLFSAGNGTFTSYYNYDLEGNRTRKVVEKGNIVETRYYIGGYEIYRKYTNDTLTLERSTVNIADDEKVFVCVETETGQSEVIRYQYDNHLGSACLELDEQGYIISYEEYHPFGTTSYRSGRSETEVSQKRYKYNGKERDEETGLYMYGMRYYAAWLCRFVSVDPLQFEYPHVNPYCYCNNNPVNLVDPTGIGPEDPDDPPMRPDQFYSPDCGEANTTMTDYPLLDTPVDAGIWINGADENAIQYVPGMEYNGDDTFIGATVNALNTLYNGSSTAAELIANLVGSEFTYNIIEADENKYNPDSPIYTDHNNPDKGQYYVASGGTIKWNKDRAPFGVPVQRDRDSIYLSIECHNPTISLLHELAHAEDNRTGILVPPSAVAKNDISVNEWRATDVENSVRSEMKLPLRTHYGLNGNTKTPVKPDLLRQDGKIIYSIYSNRQLYPKPK